MLRGGLYSVLKLDQVVKKLVAPSVQVAITVISLWFSSADVVDLVSSISLLRDSDGASDASMATEDAVVISSDEESGVSDDGAITDAAVEANQPNAHSYPIERVLGFRMINGQWQVRVHCKIPGSVPRRLVGT